MNSIFRILLRVLAIPFFRENAGAFIFFFTVMLLAVGRLKGAGTVEYHYSLIMGTLKSTGMFILVCIAWLLYELKCLVYVLRTIRNPEYQFLYVFNRLSFVRRFNLVLLMMILLFAPIGWYGLLIIGVAWHHHFYIAVILLSAYLVLIVVAPATWVVYKLRYPGIILYRMPKLSGMLPGYPGLLVRFVAAEQKVIFLTIKLFSCSLLYGFARINSLTDYEPHFPFLFFSFGILANGVIIHRIRNFEETLMVSYRSAAVSLSRRFIGYFIVYGISLIPEFIAIVWLTPVHLHYDDAWRYALCGFGLVMLLNSICFLEDFTMKQYLWVILVLLCMEYFFVLSDSLTALYIIYFVVAAVIFYTSFYQFEKRPNIRT